MEARVILIADDHPAILLSLQFLFEGYGFRVHTAENGGAALKLLGRVNADLAILDLDMPDMTGMEVAAVCNAYGARRPALMALTGNGQHGVEARCLAAGFDVVCFKPVHPEKLMRAVAALLAAASGGRSSQRFAAPALCGYA